MWDEGGGGCAEWVSEAELQEREVGERAKRLEAGEQGGVNGWLYDTQQRQAVAAEGKGSHNVPPADWSRSGLKSTPP